MADFSLTDFFTAYHGCDDAQRQELQAWLCEYYRPRPRYPAWYPPTPPPPVEITPAVAIDKLVQTPWQILNLSKYPVSDAVALIALVMTDAEECRPLLRLHVEQCYCEPASARQQILKQFVFAEPASFQPLRPHKSNLAGYWPLFTEIVTWLRENASQAQSHA